MVDEDFDEALGETISGQVGKNPNNEEDTGPTGTSGDRGDGGNTGNSKNPDNKGNSGDTGDRENVKNYPFYISEQLREELDQLYNQYDGKNKVEGGDGIEKHAEFLEPIMQEAIDELDLDEIVPYETDE